VGGQTMGNELPRISEMIRWSLPKGRKKTLFVQEWAMRTMAYSRDGKFVVVGDWRGVTKLVDPANGRVIRFLPAHSGLVNSVALSADSKMIASASFDGSVTVCDSDGKELEKFEYPDEKFQSVAISPDNGTLMAATRSGKAYVFDLANHSPARTVQACSGPPRPGTPVETVVFNPDGSSFATGCQRTLKIWDAKTGNLNREVQSSAGEFNAGAYSPKGDVLATLDSAGILTLWNTATGEQIKSTPAHRGLAYWVAFSPDGKRLATTGLSDYTLKVWDPETLECITTIHRKAESQNSN
jgi:WD40 repeat protein